MSTYPKLWCGAVSYNAIHATFKTSHELRAPIGLCVSTGQINHDGGYVMNMQSLFEFIAKLYEEYPRADVPIQRDHLLRHEDTARATEIAKKDVALGVRRFHIDARFVGDVPLSPVDLAIATDTMARRLLEMSASCEFEIGPGEWKDYQCDSRTLVRMLVMAVNVDNVRAVALPSGVYVEDNVSKGRLKWDVDAMRDALSGTGWLLVEHNADFNLDGELRQFDSIKIAPALAVSQTIEILSQAHEAGLDLHDWYAEVVTGPGWMKWCSGDVSDVTKMLAAGHYHYGSMPIVLDQMRVVDRVSNVIRRYHDAVDGEALGSRVAVGGEPALRGEADHDATEPEVLAPEA